MTSTPPEDETYALLSFEEFQARLEWTLDDDEKRLAYAALEDLSDDARHYGRSSWTTPETTPRQVKSLIRRAAARFLRNPDGFTVSRAGDETVGWTDKGDSNGVVTFSEKEIAMLRQMGGQRTIVSVEINAWNSESVRVEGLVPTEGGGDPFPFYNSDTEPW